MYGKFQNIRIPFHRNKKGYSYFILIIYVFYKIIIKYMINILFHILLDYSYVLYRAELFFSLSSCINKFQMLFEDK